MIPIVCLDVGGSSVKAAVTTAEHPVPSSTERYELDSRASADTIIARLAEIVYREAERNSLVTEAVRESSPALMVGLGFPGPCDYEAGICYLRGLTKFESLYGLSVRDLLGERLGDLLGLSGSSAVRMRNDAEAAILGEALYGAGRDASTVLGLTLGTGMGSSLIHRREVVRFSTPYNDRDELFPWPVRDPAELETERPADEVFSTRGILRLARSRGLQIASPRELSEHALAGSSDALEVYNRFGARLGTFLSEVIAHLGEHGPCPGRVVLLGGIAGAFKLFEPALRPQLSVPVVSGTLGEAAAIAGITALFSA